MQTVTVPLGERSYDVRIGKGILSRTGQHAAALGGARAAAVITDDHVAPLYLQTVTGSLQAAGLQTFSRVLPHGEQTKSLSSLSSLYAFLAESGIQRSDLIIALGGGVIGDLAGFAAATWLRGIRLIQLPTSLLAQVDSSVGGKVAVDMPFGKNMVGAFHQPSLVLCDPTVLDTLPETFWRDGLGEVVKYGCIMDEPLFSLLEEQAASGRPGIMQVMDTVLSSCIQDKADVVARDEHDTGLRMILNFGHTLGHAIETCQHYEGLTHGCAVAVGMQIITELSEARSLTEPGTAARLRRLLEQLSLPHTLPPIQESLLLQAMQMDKKNLNASLHLVILDRIGTSRLLHSDPGFFAGMTQAS